MMIDAVKEVFWLTATQLVELIVPIIVIVLSLSIVASLIFGRSKP